MKQLLFIIVILQFFESRKLHFSGSFRVRETEKARIINTKCYLYGIQNIKLIAAVIYRIVSNSFSVHCGRRGLNPF